MSFQRKLNTLAQSKRADGAASAELQQQAKLVACLEALQPAHDAWAANVAATFKSMLAKVKSDNPGVSAPLLEDVATIYAPKLGKVAIALEREDLKLKQLRQKVDDRAKRRKVQVDDEEEDEIDSDEIGELTDQASDLSTN